MQIVLGIDLARTAGVVGLDSTGGDQSPADAAREHRGLHGVVAQANKVARIAWAVLRSGGA